MSEIRR